ncbi:hypothetical protein ACFLTJ_02860 [Chloroflexota bacterium]
MLRVYVSPPNSGRVSFNGEEITQLMNYASRDFPRGTDVVLEAIPAFGYRFNYWSGDIKGNERAFKVRMKNSKRATANFSRIIPNWLIAISVIAISAPLLFRWLRRRRTSSAIINYDKGAL